VLVSVSMLLVAYLVVVLWRGQLVLVRAAYTDALTGLNNRRRLTADLNAGLRRATAGDPLLLILCDLNGFKGYNDTFGHPAGDALLKEVAQRLTTQLRTVGFVSADDSSVAIATTRFSGWVEEVPVAQGQHAVRELADELEKRGVEVEYAIHPVAGRMPGHMNVLLAEANVPYEQLKEMDQINDEFKSADVALVVGANDVVNPAAHNSPGSPIYGMPILNADEAKNIVFMKRSMRPGFAGIDNELLYDPKTVMLFGDAKDSLMKLVAAVKAA